jgi:crotonobetainyl-CoA:carnitine CoA-transferase CaiB-like acyl-CoA transferase
MYGTREGPLSAVRVIDFGQYIAGPGAAMILADQGAEVVRIERPGGPAMPSPANAVYNRGKRSVVLDLKTREGLAAAVALIDRADVVIENFRPGVMARLGLGYEALRSRNRGLVYLSLPGFSRADVENAGIPGWEGVVAAAMGQYTDMGLNRVLMGISASYSPLGLASAYASIFGAMSIVLALRARETDRHGDWIEVPLAAALMEGLAYNSMWVEDLPERYKSLREREMDRRRALGLPMNLSYEALQEFLDPFYRTYRCRDDRLIYVVAGSHSTHAEKVLRGLGLWDEMVAAGLPNGDPYLPIRDWPNGANSTLKAYPITEPWAGRLTARMAEAFMMRDAADWERLLGDAGAPVAMHRTTRQWLAAEHPRKAGLVIVVDDADHGSMAQPGPVAWLSGCPPVVAATTSSRQEQDSAASPSSKGSAARVAREKGETLPKPWLDGITILDLTNVIAGPTIGGTLARFGARVIKIDPPSPSFDPWNTVIMGLYANRGKESSLVDLKTKAGRDILHRLISRVDVVTINAMARQLPALGLDIEELQQINPRIILCHLDAFGGPAEGPRSNHPGYDDLVQASTGIMERFGGSMETVEEHAHFGTIDVLGGLSAAFAVSLALRRRDQTGRGDVARSSLVAAGQWLQSRFFYDFEGRPPFDEARGRDARGEAPNYRCYQAADGWFFFAMGQNGFDRLVKSGVIDGLAQRPVEQREAYLEAAFIQQPLLAWREKLQGFDAAMQPLGSLSDMRRTTISRSPDETTIVFRHEENHPSGRAVQHVEPTAVRPLRAPIIRTQNFEKYGKSTAPLMRELGFTELEIVDLARQGVISHAWIEDYLPD